MCALHAPGDLIIPLERRLTDSLAVELELIPVHPARFAVAALAAGAVWKSIRRAFEEDVLYWCAEFYRARPTNLWKRLRVIASEDIGIASPSAALTVRALYENWKDFRDKGLDGEELFVTHDILVLVQAKKSRLVDHATIAAFGLPANQHKSLLDRRDVPNYAVDKHTSRGRQLGHGYKHFFQKGAHLENRPDVPDPYESRVRAALEKK